MRKLGKSISSKGKTVKKSSNTLITELTNNKVRKVVKGETVVKTVKKITRLELSKQLGISVRTLNSYKWYLNTLEGIKTERGKYDYKPRNEKEFLKKLKKVASKYKVKQTQTIVQKHAPENVKQFSLIDKKEFNRIVKQVKAEKDFGFLIRVNVLFITKDGNFQEWFTSVPPIKTSKDLLKFGNLDKFLKQEFSSYINSKKNLYSFRQNVLAIEILETIITPTLKEFEPNKPKSKKKR